ncbi:MAG: MoxR family ATPase [Defluviitaleaceae bacterium]|nr:MoxR family ATPase [Defluviitaleaceae bacterium]
MSNTPAILNNIIDNVEKVIVGKRKAIEFVIVSLLSRGHVLIEDMPGVGKTSLISALAKSVDCSFKRIQFTPDIMPSDITGFSMYNQKLGDFEYHPGLIMSQFVLADEINRTSPKTQSSLLEVMEENQVTVDGNIYKTPTPFIVFATQNPIEYLGTYPLPEAQLDRFFMKISIGYPNKDEELSILERHKKDTPLQALETVVSSDEIINMQHAVLDIHMDKSVAEYVVAITRATREQKSLALGASPRATLCLHRAAQAYAYIKGRDYCLPDDVMELSAPVLSHRVIVSHESRLKKITPEVIIGDILQGLKAPVI